MTRAWARRPILAALVADGGDARATVDRLGLAAVRDDAALVPAVEAAMAEHPDKVAADPRRRGQTRRLPRRRRRCGRAPKGADPKRVQELLRERLGTA